VGEREVRLLGIAVAGEDETYAVVPGGLTPLEHECGLRTQVVPRFVPDLARRPAEGPRMALPQDGNVRVVVEVGELRAPPDEHRIARLQHETDRRAQALGPL